MFSHDMVLAILPLLVVLNRSPQYHLTPKNIRLRRFDLQSRQWLDQLLRYTFECELAIYGERQLVSIQFTSLDDVLTDSACKGCF